MNKLNCYLFLLCVFILTGCGGDRSDDVVIYRAHVEAKPSYIPFSAGGGYLNAKVTGVGGPDTTALEISGFTHQFGTSYELEIRYEWLGTTVPDSPSFTIEVLKVINAKQDPVGTTYIYSSIGLVSAGFIRKDTEGKYWISSYQFLCAKEIDCDTLVHMSNSGGKVDLEFTLTGGEVPVTLTHWL